MKCFTLDEFRCKHCGGLPEGGMDEKLLELCDAIRERIGKPVTVLSGYRCPEHNRDIGAAVFSQHMFGTAADLTYEDIDVDYLAEVAEECGADGIGKYYSSQFVHVDTRDEYARWEEE